MQMQEPVETAELLAFARTVDAGSLSRAAAELGLPRATISRRLARLEERLRTRLLRRTTRSLALTDAGQALYRHARIVLDAVRDAETSVRRTDDAVRGELRVSVLPYLPPSFHAMVGEFALRYPDVRIQIQATSRRVDLHRDAYDVALRATSQLEPGLIARRLATDRLIAVASPAYLDAHGVPATRRDLARHRCLLRFTAAGAPAPAFPTRGGAVPVDGVFFSDELPMLLHAALHGVGIAMLPVMFVHDFVEERALLQVLPGVLELESHVAIVYAEREFVPPQVRAFIDAVVAWAPTELGRTISPECKAAIRGRGNRSARARVR
jgi:DNA-binding transcriptional LysR family regulator